MVKDLEKLQIKPKPFQEGFLKSKGKISMTG